MRWVIQLALTTTVATPLAEAGPWGQVKGDAFARAAYSNEQIDGADAWRVDAYGEYGISSDWTLIAKAESVSFPNAAEFDASEARLVFQRRFIENKYITLAAGGGAVYGAAIGGAEGCDTWGGETRMSAGSSGKLGERDWYASIDLSSRWHSDGCQRNKLDLVAGYKARKNTIVSPQLYVERSNRGADSTAVQIEWIHQLEGFDLTFGYKYESGELFDQQATIIAISKRF